jgi:hypothetical protein
VIKYILLIMLAVTSVSFAAIYTSTDKNGNIFYSDTPSRNATVISAPTTNHYQREPTQPTTTETTASSLVKETTAKEAPPTYTTFAISSPTDQQTFQNQRDIPITIHIEPELGPTDKIRLLLDGAPYGTAENKTTISLFQVDRGMHQISAQLLDKNQTVIKQTPAITIYIQYASVLRP